MTFARVRRARGAYTVVTFTVLLFVAFATFIFGRSNPTLTLQKAPFGRLADVPAFDPIEDVTLGLPTDSGTSKIVPPAEASIRAMELYRTQIVMLAGGKAVRLITLKQPITSLHQLVGVVNDPDWISESGTHITMNAGIITEVDTDLNIAAPTTTDVTMNVRQGVLLAALQATLDFNGVYVHASNPNTPHGGSKTAVRTDLGRPLIFASNASTMNMTNSRFAYLGRDWNSSYGASWSKKSTGTVKNSTFDHDFIGVYTDHAVNLEVIDSTFLHNALYGIDPHSSSTNLLIEGNTSDYNGRHGIIFSNNVTHSVVKDNTTDYNGLNGIMMDEASSGNTITNNVSIDNQSDGITMADSSRNVITYNTVRGNRVGLHSRGNSVGNAFSQNTVENNLSAAQGVDLAQNHASDNGGQWQLDRMVTVWLAGLVALFVFYLATFISYRLPGKKRLGSTAKVATTAKLEGASV
jgi:mannuronan 5-epimerase